MTSTPREGPRLRVAVADDEPEMRDYLREVLPRLGHEVVAVAASGRQLVEQVRAVLPDLVITDVRMPDLDGIEAAAAGNADRHVPVILVSAFHDAGTLNRLTERHIMGYLVKPVSEEDLKVAISLAMTRSRHFLQTAKEAADLRQALEDRKLIEKAKGVIMKRLRVDEDEAFRRLLKLASDQNLKLVEVGRRVIASEEVFQRLEHG